ncbi:MAG: tRNA dihydrouridine synthase DusB [Actinobacteria bacterium]|nr:tRNA dihydrouridine synthase DusB [Actinomycetota bacterium]
MTRAAAALRIGPLTVDPPVVLAPMAGVTNAAFRALCRSFGAGLYVSEMITARALVERNGRTMQMVSAEAGESPRSVQIYGVDPAVVGEAVRRLVGEVGVHHVDLNLGCPAAKVTRKGGGAALPVRRALLRSIVRAAVLAAEPAGVPVSLKFRIGVDARLRTFLDTGRIAEDEGAAAVALHARTAEQLYSGGADWGAIAELKAAVTTIPVLGNGDVFEAGDALRMMARTGCDGVVVGRGCLGRPWLFGQLADAFAGRPVRPEPPLGEVVAVLQRHAVLLGEHLGTERAAREIRKHTGWYLKGFPVGGDRRARLAQVATLAELDELLHALVDELGADLPSPPGAGRLVRGHTAGPRPVALPAGWLARADDPTPLPPEAHSEVHAISGG